MPFYVCVICRGLNWYDGAMSIASQLCGCGKWHKMFFQYVRTRLEDLWYDNNGEMYDNDDVIRVSIIADDVEIDQKIRTANDHIIE